jgi:hypothetical protein
MCIRKIVRGTGHTEGTGKRAGVVGPVMHMKCVGQAACARSSTVWGRLLAHDHEVCGAGCLRTIMNCVGQAACARS